MRVSALRSLGGFAALVAAAVLGGAVAVGATALLGGLGGDTTVVTQTTSAASSQPVASGGRMSISEIYKRAAPGVVQITSTTNATTQVDPFFGDQFQTPPQQALGSGFVLDKAGHIVTNFHVVQGADDIKVGFSNRDTVKAKVVGTDESTDLAVLRVQVPASALTPLPLGDSEGLEVGDQVVAIGNPFGLVRTATAGIVSALQRNITSPNNFTIGHVIQTDAPINHGNSGGPLLNTSGQVIGVNSQIETGDTGNGNVGIGFAVASNTVKNVVAQLLRTGKVDHAYIGVLGQAITSDLARTFKLPVSAGVLVQAVRKGTGAAKAGLRAGDTQVVVAGETYVLGGDIIVGADGKQISAIDQLTDVVAAHKPGDKIKLQIYRDAKKTSVKVTLGRQPTSSAG
jgi:S1-C subfamily serine protease